APIERVWSPATGTVALPYDHWRQGDHVREGLVLATGPGIRPGRRRGSAGTERLAATFSAAAGVSLPGLDGAALASMVPSPARSRLPRPRAAAAARARAAVTGGAHRLLASRPVPAWRDRSDSTTA